LTHDYLVPALRQWLTRKQRETRRGRMQLLLAERAALWGAKQERKQLPGWWEWANISLYTRSKDWTALEHRMLGAASRRHLLQAGVLLLLLGLVGWAIVEVYRGPVKAAALVRALKEADTTRVPQILEELDSCRRWAKPLLEEMLEESRHDSKEELHARLALLPLDPERQKHYLYEKMLRADPAECTFICYKLLDYSQDLVPQLVQLLQVETDRERRFRAAYALATYDPDAKHVNWEQLGAEVADKLVKENPLRVAQWQRNVIALRFSTIRPHLHKTLKNRDRPVSERFAASKLITMYYREAIVPNTLAMLLDILLDAEGAA